MKDVTRRNLQNLVLVLIVAGLFAASTVSTFAQSAARIPHPNNYTDKAADNAKLLRRPSTTLPYTTACSYNFASGSGDSYMQYCVTANGNIPQLQSPAGQSIIGSGITVGEGYGVCNETPATAYWDYAGWGDSGNWGAATTLSQTATSVKIARTTSDGIWTLTQTLTQDKSTPAVKITMALKNNTAVSRRAYLVRYADVDAGNWINDVFDATADSAFGWASTTGVNDGWGLTIKNVGTRWGYTNGFGQPIFNPPNPCAFAFNWIGLVGNTDGSIVLAYADTIGAHQTKTATMVYRGM
jgi:hypothetical protein